MLTQDFMENLDVLSELDEQNGVNKANGTEMTAFWGIQRMVN